MKHHPVTASSSADEQYVRRWVTYCRAHNQHVMGFWFALEPVKNAGVDITLFATVTVHRSHLDRAILELKLAYDVESSTILIVPKDWLEPQENEAHTEMRATG